MEQSLCTRPRASWASVLWSVHIFHLVCAGQALAYGLGSSLRAGPVEQPGRGGGVNCPRVLAKEHIPPQITGMDREGTWTVTQAPVALRRLLPVLALWPQVTGALRCHRGRPSNGPRDQDEQAETQAAEATSISWSPAGTQGPLSGDHRTPKSNGSTCCGQEAGSCYLQGSKLREAGPKLMALRSLACRLRGSWTPRVQPTRSSNATNSWG